MSYYIKVYLYVLVLKKLSFWAGILNRTAIYSNKHNYSPSNYRYNFYRGALSSITKKLKKSFYIGSFVCLNIYIVAKTKLFIKIDLKLTDQL